MDLAIESMSNIAPYRVSVGVLPSWGELAQIWSDLEARATGSFFTSWTWIGTWLSLLPQDELELRLVSAYAGPVRVAVGILCRAPRRLLPVKQPWLLNQTGRPPLDSIYIEYNDFLVDSDHPAARVACFQTLVADCDSPLHANAATAAASHAVTQAAVPHRITRHEDCAYLDFHIHEPNDVESLLTQLGRNTRQQCRRAIRLFEQNAPLQITRADAQTATAALNVLIDLHQTAWTARKGLPGAFAGPFLHRFVSRLVETGVPTNAVDLLHVTAGAKTLGVLLNFVHRGNVYAYQSGFAYSDDNRLKPGLVSHLLAAAHYRGQGCHSYHFMAGAGRYKTALSNATEPLYWLETASNSRFSRMEAGARTAWHKFRRLASGLGPP